MQAILYTDQYLKYDAEASQLGVNQREFEFNAEITLNDEAYNTWVAFMFIDVNGNYVITNPYWLVVDTSEMTFSDVPVDAWYAPFVLQLVEEEIINGYPDGTFRPDGEITRAEFAKMMSFAVSVTAVSVTEDAKDVSFSDVQEGAWYYDAVMRLASEGYINGYPDGTFKPDAKITRAEMSAIISNICGDLKVAAQKSFNDVTSDQWFYDEVMNLANAGYLEGYPDGTFKPDNNATRAEASKLVFVALNNGYLLNEAE